MKKETIAAILGFFVWGLFYVERSKKIFMAIAGLCVASYVLVNFVSPTAGLIVNIAGAYLGHKWMKEKLDAEGETTMIEE